MVLGSSISYIYLQEFIMYNHKNENRTRPYQPVNWSHVEYIIIWSTRYVSHLSLLKAKKKNMQSLRNSNPFSVLNSLYKREF